MNNQTYTSELDDYLEVDTVEYLDVSLCSRTINHETFPKILNVNIRSINKNFEMFEVLLHEIKIDFDIMVLTECWLNGESMIKDIAGYTSYQSHKHYNQNDGVVIYIRDELSVSIDEPDEVIDANCLVAKIDNNVKIIAIYRPPSFTDPKPFIDSISGVLGTDRDITIFTGDMNIDISNHSSTSTQQYLNVMAIHGLQSAINKPTRNDSCLDHIMIRTGGEIRAAVCQAAITDHFPVMAGIVTKRVRNDPIKTEITRFNSEKFIESVRHEEWELVYGSADVDESFNSFETRLRELINDSKTTSIKHRRLERRRIKEWITVGILKCLRRRDRLHKLVNEQKSNRHLSEYYKRYRNICSKIVKKGKEIYFSKKIQNDGQKPRECWKIMREYLNIKNSSKSYKSLIDTRDDQHVLEDLNRINEYFGTIGRKLTEDGMRDAERRTDRPSDASTIDIEPLSSFFAYPTDASEVTTVLKNLRRNTSPGIDDIKTEMLQMVKDEIAPPIAHIFNLSIEQGIFPERAKVALLVPIHKKGDTRDVSNYRPISLLTALSKVLEKLMTVRLVGFLEAFNILSENQYGFRRGKSTEGAILRLTHFVSHNLDDGDKCVGVFMDLAKAFDTVPHDGLLRKLHRVGVRGKLNEWFESYISERKQVIRYDKVRSDELTITHGVPQGSILGPVLFLVYINDLCNKHLNKGDIVTFADDTALLFHGRTWEEVVQNSQEGFNTVAEWLRLNKLTLNAEKTNYVCFTINKRTKPSPGSIKIIYHQCKGTEVPQLDCSCRELMRCDAIKYLGVEVDENLNWRQHIIGLTSRVRKLMYIFRQLRAILPIDQLKVVYYALCHSLIGYAIVGWGGAAKTVLDPLFGAQKLVIKVTYGLNYMYPTVSLFMDTRILSVRQTYVHKIVMREVKNGVEGRARTGGRVVTGRQIIYVPRCRTTFCQRFPSYMGPKLFNTVKSRIGRRNMNARDVKEFLIEKGVIETEEYVSERIV
jgi:hypothetical protein